MLIGEKFDQSQGRDEASIIKKKLTQICRVWIHTDWFYSLKNKCALSRQD